MDPDCNYDWLQVDGIKYCDGRNPFPLALGALLQQPHSNSEQITTIIALASGSASAAALRCGGVSSWTRDARSAQQGGATSTWLAQTRPAIDCIACDTGHYAALTGSDEANDCIACGKGQYAAVPGLDTCIRCGAGRFIDVTGSDEASDCIACGTGRYADMAGLGTCIS